MEGVQQTMVELLIAALKTANTLIARGHAEFWCFGIGLRPDGCKVCVVSNEADFFPILGAQPQINEQIHPSITAIGPSMTTECLNANKDESNADDWGYWATIAQLQDWAEEEEIIASAIVLNGLAAINADSPEQTVEVELEHQSGWTMLYAQPYSVEGSTFTPGEASQFDHDLMIFDTPQ